MLLDNKDFESTCIVGVGSLEFKWRKNEGDIEGDLKQLKTTFTEAQLFLPRKEDGLLVQCICVCLILFHLILQLVSESGAVQEMVVPYDQPVLDALEKFCEKVMLGRKRF